MISVLLIWVIKWLTSSRLILPRHRPSCSKTSRRSKSIPEGCRGLKNIEPIPCSEGEEYQSFTIAAWRSGTLRESLSRDPCSNQGAAKSTSKRILKVPQNKVFFVNTCSFSLLLSDKEEKKCASKGR